MSTRAWKVQGVLAHAERRLLRRLMGNAWLIKNHRYKWSSHLGIIRKWKVSYLQTTTYPGWYDHNKLWLHYNDLTLLAMESETLVLRLRALLHHRSTCYLDPRYTKLPSVRDFDTGHTH